MRSTIPPVSTCRTTRSTSRSCSAARSRPALSAPRTGHDSLLAQMTEDVGALVLRDNYLQGEALSVAEARGPSALDRQTRLIRELERAGRLDRALEYLPDDEALASRAASRRGLTRPEL